MGWAISKKRQAKNGIRVALSNSDQSRDLKRCHNATVITDLISATL